MKTATNEDWFEGTIAMFAYVSEIGEAVFTALELTLIIYRFNIFIFTCLLFLSFKRLYLSELMI